MNIKFYSGEELLKALPAPMAEKLEALGAFQKKVLEYLAMFLVLWAIDSSHLKASFTRTGTTTVTLDFALLLVLLKFFLFTGWPYALIAYLDETWRSQDAAHVYLAAYVASNMFMIHKYPTGFCPYSAAFGLMPYVFSAGLGHKIGSSLRLPGLDK